MSGPSYTSKWRCKECGQIYGHNPSECEICGHTIFRPLPADEISGTSDTGEHTTELGAEISDLVEQTDQEDNQERMLSDSDEPDGATNDEDEIESKSADIGFLSRLLSWFR